MRSKTKLIALDLDGTLLTSEKKITPYTGKILQDAAAQGIIVMPATGRPISGIPKELFDILDFKYAVTANGGRIIDMRQNKAIYECPVPLETARILLDIFEHYDTLREIYYDGKGYAEKDALEDIDRYLEEAPMADYLVNTRIAVPDIRAKFEEENRGSDKVQAIFENIEDRNAALEELKAIPDIEVTGALTKNIEVNAAGVSKGNALIQLGMILGISREEIMAFGDGSNDLSMIHKAGIGVAMLNGTEEVRAAADYVTTLSNDEDGVAHFIEEHVLQ